MKQRKIKVFIGLLEVAGYFGSLNSGFHDLGIESYFFQFQRNKYYNHGTRFMRFCQSVQLIRQVNKINSVTFLPLDIFLRTIVLCWAIFSFNIFVFASTSTFFRYKELWLFKKLGKKIIYVFLGTESRPDYLSGNLINALYIKNGEITNIDKCIKNTLIKKKVINKIEKYADFCINHPPCAIFHTKPYIKWSYIGFPFHESKIKKTEEKPNKKYNDRMVILHAPSNPQTKGTFVIREIMTKLKNEKVNIEYIEMIGQSNDKVLELLNQCDFVVDELYSDISLGGIGVEAAFSGKTTVNAGYYDKYMERDYGKDVIPPSIFCEPDEIEEKIRLLIFDKEYCRKLGRDAYGFVIKNWSAKEVATRYLRLINDDIPKEWIGDPYALNYIYGYGQSKDQLKKIIDVIKEKKGNNGFAISDKPNLLDMLLNMS